MKAQLREFFLDYEILFGTLSAQIVKPYCTDLLRSQLCPKLLFDKIDFNPRSSERIIITVSLSHQPQEQTNRYHLDPQARDQELVNGGMEAI
jgi:hypothetical protein